MNAKMKTNLSVLANATEFATAVVRKVSGETISTQVGGKTYSSDDIKHAVAAKLQSGLIVEGGKTNA